MAVAVGSSRRLSVVVPTRNEAGNVGPLLARLLPAIEDLDAEVLFVDDSDDDTPQQIELAAAGSTVPVRVCARPRGQRPGGLGGAVRTGIELARGHWVCVMDGDLQHPPELIIELLDRIESTGVDVVVASRLAPGGSVGGLGSIRTLASRSIAVLTRALFLDRLSAVSDPMTGFFLLRRDRIDPSRLEPDGFKILLDILIRNPGLEVTEIPFQFGSRHADRSKAGLIEVVRLTKKLAVLSLASGRLSRFLVVGASGFVVNNAVMAALTEAGGVHYLASAVAATAVTTIWNFALTDRWVFSDRDRAGPGVRRFGSFALLSLLGLAARSPLLFLLTSGLGLHYLLSNMASIGLLTGFRYVLAARWIWRPSPHREG